MALVGRGALALALLLAVYAVVTAVLAGRRRDLRYVESARHALYAVLAAVLVADFVFLLAIVRHDFSFVIVADTTSRDLPLGYLLSSFWGSQAGSLMLWLTILSAATVVVIRTNRRSHGELMPWVMAIMGGTAAFFALLVVVAASPFETQVAPVDGNGLNPSLQNPYMVAHPPALYLGYVGLTVPFAFCMAALAAGAARRPLDRLDAALDARGVGVPRRRDAARRPLGLRRGRAGAATGPGIRSRTPR